MPRPFVLSAVAPLVLGGRRDLLEALRLGLLELAEVADHPVEADARLLAHVIGP